MSSSIVGSTSRPVRTGGRILVDQLRLHGADTVFSVPGESFLEALDALHDRRGEVRLIVTRHEAGAANMAEAYGKLLGRPGICLVNRGPGATHASVGLHTGYQDSTPMIALIGQAPRPFLGREAFQEVDHRLFLAELTKWSAQVERADRLPEMVSRAFHTSLAGRPGPVALVIPEDVMAEASEVPDAEPYRVTRPHPDPEDMVRMRQLLAEAERPLMIVGGGGWTSGASRDVRAFAEANRLPTVASFRCQDYIDNRSDIYVGYAGLAIRSELAERIRRSDFLLVVGARLGEATTDRYSLVQVPVPRQTLVHVHAGHEELGSVYRADLPINAGYPEFAAAARALEPVDSSPWAGWAESARAQHLAGLRPPPAPGALNLAEVVRHVNDLVPDDAIVTNGAGNFTVWAHRYHEFHEFRSQLGPTSGAMGYGIPAAVAAKLVHPERTVVCYTGDGDALMSFQELATAAQYGLDPIVLLVNNGMYATIRMHQERRFPGRVHGTDLVNPSFVALAESFGAHGEMVERTEDFPAAFERCLGAGRLSLIELLIDPEQLTPTSTLSGTRRAAEGRHVSGGTRGAVTE